MTIIIKINPLSYGVDGVRGSLGTSALGLGIDFAVMAIGIIVISLIGTYSFSKIQV